MELMKTLHQSQYILELMYSKEEGRVKNDSKLIRASKIFIVTAERGLAASFY